MKLKKKLRLLTIASSIFLTASLMSCYTPLIVTKHKFGNTMYKQVEQPKKKYAILILGSNSKDNIFDNFLDSLALEVYEGLKNLDFSDENINFIVSPDSKKLSAKNVDFDFTKDNVKNAFSDISKKITKDDLLMFYFIGHGNKDLRSMGSENYGISLRSLEKEMVKLKYSHAILVFDSCYSGLFAKSLGKENRIAISTTEGDNKGWTLSSFDSYFMDGLKGEKEADKNEDGKVSLEEAVYYAAENDPLSKKTLGFQAYFPEPQIYYEDIDPSKIFLKEKEKSF